ncbi:MAG: hypothetical protein ABSD59_15510 [Terracidiphilus sp.]|jgi:hypothetical protein
MAINSDVNMHICLLNDFISRSFLLISSVVPPSPDAIAKLEASRDIWQSSRTHHFSELLLMTKLVAVGVLLEGPELIYEICKLIRLWRTKGVRDHSPGWITVIGLVGWILVFIGVAGEFWVDSWVNTDDDNIQSINITLLRDANSSAAQAKKDAGEAQTLAHGARTEADSFARDIADAKREAADAVSRLADAEQRLADATQREANAEEEINRLKSPRTLTNASVFSSDLNQFAGTEYTFSLVFSDLESVTLLKQIDSALQLAGWKRVNPSPTPTVNVKPYPDQDLIVGIGDTEGVEIDVDSTASFDFLNKNPQSTWPRLVLAAALLRNELALHITPMDGNVNKQLVISPGGSSTAIRINVGKKRP